MLYSNITNLSSKTIYNQSNLTKGENVSAIEAFIAKCGNVVSGFAIVTTSADISSNGEVLISGLPNVYGSAVQLMCVSLSGSDQFRTSRVRVSSNYIGTWYGMTLKAGAPYLISVNYICE